MLRNLQRDFSFGYDYNGADMSFCTSDGQSYEYGLMNEGTNEGSNENKVRQTDRKTQTLLIENEERQERKTLRDSTTN